MAVPEKVKIVGLGGSLKEGSASLLTLRVALQGAASVGAETELLDIRTLDLPMYTPDTVPTAAVQRLVDTVGPAHGMIWSSPVYHGSISGAFKNVLDWMELLNKHEPAYLTDKVVGLIATAGGVQGMHAISTMEFVVRALRGWTLPLVAPIDRAGQAFDETGQIRDDKLRARLLQVGTETALAARKMSRPL